MFAQCDGKLCMQVVTRLYLHCRLVSSERTHTLLSRAAAFSRALGSVPRNLPRAREGGYFEGTAA